MPILQIKLLIFKKKKSQKKKKKPKIGGLNILEAVLFRLCKISYGLLT